MKELLKQAFQAGKDYRHAMGTGKPTYGLTFNEWYSENEDKALSIFNAVAQSELLSCDCPICGKEMTSQLVKHHHCKYCKEHYTTT